VLVLSRPDSNDRQSQTFPQKAASRAAHHAAGKGGTAPSGHRESSFVTVDGVAQYRIRTRIVADNPRHKGPAQEKYQTQVRANGRDRGEPPLVSMSS